MTSKNRRKAPALTPRVFSAQYEALLLQGLKNQVDLVITDQGEDEVADALHTILGKKNWTKEDLLRVSALTFTMAMIADKTGEDYESDDEDVEDDEDDEEDGED